MNESSYDFFSMPPNVTSDALSAFLQQCAPVIKGFGYQFMYSCTCGNRIIGDMELIYVMNGESVITINEKTYVGHANDLFVIPKYSFYRIDTNDSDPHENYWLHFDVADDILCEKLAKLLGGPLIHLPADKHIRVIYEWLDAEYLLRGIGNKTYINSLLRILLIHILRLMHVDNEKVSSVSESTNAEEPSSYTDILQKAIRLITAQHGNITVEELAKSLFICTAYLRRVFAATIGMSPQQVIQSVRMREAEILLCTTSESLSVIAGKLGFSSAYHLSNAFKQFHGVSPAEYRNSRK